MKPCCEHCRYLHATELQVDLTRKLFCRRFPPVPLAIVNGTQVQVVNVHPTVSTDHTCGEFRPLPELIS